MSIRSQIKKALKGTLEGIGRSAGFHFDVARVDLVPRHWEQVSGFPHLYLEFENETRENLAGARRRCRIAFRVVAYVRGEDADAMMEDLAEDVDRALAADTTFSGLAVDCWISEVSSTGNWETPYGMLVLSGQIVYHHEFGVP